MRRFGTTAAMMIATGGLLAQTPCSPPVFDSFEVATVKLTPPDWTGGRFIRMQTAHRFLAKNHALRTLIAAAYNLSPRAITGGPAWVDSEHYDILAETPCEVRPNLDQQMSMLRRLIVERYKLTFHREQKELSIYALTVAKGGSKLKVSTISPDASPEGPPPLVFVVSLPTLHMPARYATMGEFASVLQRAALDRPVVDQTGLTGRYDFDLDFAADETLFDGALGKAPDDVGKPGLFAAVQEQLGLKIEPTKGPVETLVIDTVERPSGN
jgi:uncharacterized protein (TIGR03435 family)